MAAQILDAWVARSGNLLFFITGSTGSSLVSIQVTNPGSGYTTATVSLSGGGTPTVAAKLGQPIIVGGKIVAIPVLNSPTIELAGYNNGYTSAPTVTISGDGTGATAVAVLGGTISNVTNVSAIPTAYVNGTAVPLMVFPQVTITAGGSGYPQRTANATITDGTHTVTGRIITSTGPTGSIIRVDPYQYWSTSWGAPSVSFSGGGGAAGTVTLVPMWFPSTVLPAACVFVQLQTPINPGDVVTYTAPVGWVTTTAGSLPAQSTPAYVANYTGQSAEPAFEIPVDGLSVGIGANLYSYPSAAFGIYSLTANYLHRSVGFGANPWTPTGGGTTTVDYYGNLQSWTGGNPYLGFLNGASNAIDSQDLPYLPGPTITAPTGSGAVFVPIISGGVIQSIYVANGGSGYPATGSLSITRGGGWGAAATFTASGGVISSVTVQSGGAGYSDGIWKVTWDDTAPSSPTTLTLIDTGNLGYNVTITPLTSGMPSGLSQWVSAGTLSGGTQLGVQTAAYVAWKPGASKWVSALAIQASGGAVSGSTHTNGATNICITPPNMTPDRSGLGLAPDANVLAWFNYGNNQYARIVRTTQIALGASLPISNGYVNYDTILTPSDPSWGPPNLNVVPSPGAAGTAQIGSGDPTAKGSYSFWVDAIRPYDVSVSPNIYIDENLPGTVADGTLAPYRFSPPNIGWLNAQNTGAVVMECVAPGHGLKTGQQPIFTGVVILPASGNPAPSPFLSQNGVSGGIQAYVGETTLRGNTPTVWVTGKDTFVVATYNSKSTGSGQQYWKFEQVYCTQSQTYNSISFVNVTGGGSGMTAPPAVAIDPPSGSWRTARAVATVDPSTGAITAVNPAPDTPNSYGNNYSSTPNVKVITPSGGSGAAITANVVNGQVTSYTVTAGGSNYPTTGVGIQVDPPAQVATAAPNVSGGAVTSLTLVSGGSGYNAGAPEVIITGDGQGAKFTATVSGGVVTGFTQVSGGSGYTQANTSVAIALPPTEATAYCVLSSPTSGQINTTTLGSAAGGVNMMWPGTGYNSNTQPTVNATFTTVNGTGTAPAGTPVYAFPFLANIVWPLAGTVPYEAACDFVNRIPGCDLHTSVSLFASDACVQSIAQSIASNLAAGRKVWIQRSDEIWNYSGINQGKQSNWLANLISAGTGSSINGNKAATAWEIRTHQIFDAAFAAAGRAGDVVHLVGCWYSNPQVSADAVSYINAYNAANPSAPYRLDAICTAPYIDLRDGGSNSATDHHNAVLPGLGAVISNQSTSIGYRSPAPWSLAMWHEVLRHYMLYGGQPYSDSAAQLANVAAYSGPTPLYGQVVLEAYEGGAEHMAIQGLVQDTTSTSNFNNGTDSTLRVQLATDILYHPSMKDLVIAYHKMLSYAGFYRANYYTIEGPINANGQLWCLLNWEGQQPGAGDGSDGKPVNQYVIAGSPGDGKCHDFDNVSPALLGFQLAGAAYTGTPTPTSTPTPTPTPTPSGTPTTQIRRWFPGLRPTARLRLP